MAKRSTIGENPLDTMFQDHPLDTVVPDLSVVAKTGRGQLNAEALKELQERVGALEDALKTLGMQMTAATAAATAAVSVKGIVNGVTEELTRLRQEVERLLTQAAATKALETEIIQLKGDLAQIRAAASPGDLPWWMRGKKK